MDEQSYYDSISYGYDSLHGNEQKNKLKIIAQKLNVRKDSKLLDIGAGTGISYEFFDCEFYGIEPSPKMIDVAKKKFGPNINIIIGSANKMLHNYKHNFFDYIICVSSAHHFENPENILEIINLISTKDAKFAFSFFKKSPSTAKFLELIEKMFVITDLIEEKKDKIVFFTKKP